MDINNCISQLEKLPCVCLPPTSEEVPEGCTRTLLIKTLDRGDLSIDWDYDNNVEHLKREIANRKLIPVETQRLLFRGKVLENQSRVPLEQDLTIIHLVEKPAPWILDIEEFARQLDVLKSLHQKGCDDSTCDEIFSKFSSHYRKFE